MIAPDKMDSYFSTISKKQSGQNLNDEDKRNCKSKKSSKQIQNVYDFQMKDNVKYHSYAKTPMGFKSN